jgi:hypothetical protein
MLVTIAATSVLFNQEATFAYMITTLLHSVTSVLMFTAALSLLGSRRLMREKSVQLVKTGPGATHNPF